MGSVLLPADRSSFVGPAVNPTLVPTLPRQSDTFMRYAKALTVSEGTEFDQGVLPPMDKGLVVVDIDGNVTAYNVRLCHSLL